MVTLEEYKRAERTVTLQGWKRGFVVHAAIYTVVISALVVLNVLLTVYTDAGFFWFPFPLVGWGVGLAMHYLHGVRWAERELTARQTGIERRAHDLAGVA